MACRRMVTLNFRRLRTFTQRRTILSNAYKCVGEWESRKQSPALKDVDIYDLQNQMIVRMQAGHLPTAIDMDVAANSITHEDQTKEFEELLWKFRHSINSATVLGSTHHAIVRFCINLNLEEVFMKYLNDPINYGVFPDPYSANIMMDHFLMAGNHRDAAKIACFLLLQEEFDTESTRLFMILSCLRWINDPKPEDTQQNLEASDGDEIIFRVPWLKNPFYDDHFDLNDFNQLLGKTLIWTSDYLPNTSESERQKVLNCKILGYILREHYSDAFTALKKLMSDETLKLHKDVADKIKNILTKSDAETAKAGADGEKAAKTEKTPSDPKKEENEKLIVRIKDILKAFKTATRTTDETLADVFSNEITTRMSSLEKHDVEEQKKLFAKWNADRDRRVNSQIQQYLKKERLKIIDKELAEWQRREDYLFFFERKEKWEKKLDRKLFIRDKEIQKAPDIPKDEDYTIPEVKRRQKIAKKKELEAKTK